MKTEKEIEEMARELYGEEARLGDSQRYHLYISLYSQIQYDLLAEASEGFEEWAKNNLTDKDLKYVNEGNISPYWKPTFKEKLTPENAWQSAKLSRMRERA